LLLLAAAVAEWVLRTEHQVVGLVVIVHQFMENHLVVDHLRNLQ
jgi:hypothetical protein